MPFWNLFSPPSLFTERTERSSPLSCAASWSNSKDESDVERDEGSPQTRCTCRQESLDREKAEKCDDANCRFRKKAGHGWRCIPDKCGAFQLSFSSNRNPTFQKGFTSPRCAPKECSKQCRVRPAQMTDTKGMCARLAAPSRLECRRPRIVYYGGESVWDQPLPVISFGGSHKCSRSPACKSFFHDTRDHEISSSRASSVEDTSHSSSSCISHFWGRHRESRRTTCSFSLPTVQAAEESRKSEASSKEPFRQKGTTISEEEERDSSPMKEMVIWSSGSHGEGGDQTRDGVGTKGNGRGWRASCVDSAKEGCVCITRRRCEKREPLSCDGSSSSAYASLRELHQQYQNAIQQWGGLEVEEEVDEEGSSLGSFSTHHDDRVTIERPESSPLNHTGFPSEEVRIRNVLPILEDGPDMKEGYLYASITLLHHLEADVGQQERLWNAPSAMCSLLTCREINGSCMKCVAPHSLPLLKKKELWPLSLGEQEASSSPLHLTTNFPVAASPQSVLALSSSSCSPGSFSDYQEEAGSRGADGHAMLGGSRDHRSRGGGNMELDMCRTSSPASPTVPFFLLSFRSCSKSPKGSWNRLPLPTRCPGTHSIRGCYRDALHAFCKEKVVSLVKQKYHRIFDTQTRFLSEILQRRVLQLLREGRRLKKRKQHHCHTSSHTHVFLPMSTAATRSLSSPLCHSPLAVQPSTSSITTAGHRVEARPSVEEEGRGSADRAYTEGEEQAPVAKRGTTTDVWRCSGVLYHIEESIPAPISFLTLDARDIAWIKQQREYANSNMATTQPAALRMGGLCLSYAQLSTLLTPGEWLSDQVINAYLDLLSRKSAASSRNARTMKKLEESERCEAEDEKQREVVSLGTHFYAKVIGELEKESRTGSSSSSSFSSDGVSFPFPPLSPSSGVLRWFRRRQHILLPYRPSSFPLSVDTPDDPNQGEETPKPEDHHRHPYQYSSTRLVLIPVNLSNVHWILVAWDKEAEQFVLYDSLCPSSSTTSHTSPSHSRVLRVLRYVLKACYLHYFPSPQAGIHSDHFHVEGYEKRGWTTVPRGFCTDGRTEEKEIKKQAERTGVGILQERSECTVRSTQEWDLQGKGYSHCHASRPCGIPLWDISTHTLHVSSPTRSSLFAPSTTPSEVSPIFWIPSHWRVPQQRNGSDCGVFVCLTAWCLAQGVRVSFPTSKDSISFFRLLMGMELWSDCLLLRMVSDDREGEAQKRVSFTTEPLCHEEEDREDRGAKSNAIRQILLQEMSSSRDHLVCP